MDDVRAHNDPVDPAVINLRLENLERRMERVEGDMRPLPVLIRDVDKGFTAVDDRIDDLATSMDTRMKNLTRVLWIFAGAFATAAVSTLFLALQIATGKG